KPELRRNEPERCAAVMSENVSCEHALTIIDTPRSYRIKSAEALWKTLVRRFVPKRLEARTKIVTPPPLRKLKTLVRGYFLIRVRAMRLAELMNGVLFQ